MATFTVRTGSVATVSIEVMAVSERPSRPIVDAGGFDPQEVDEQPNGER